MPSPSSVSVVCTTRAPLSWPPRDSILSTSGEIVARLFLPPPRGLRRPFKMGRRIGPLSPSETSDPLPWPLPPPLPWPLPSPEPAPLPCVDLTPSFNSLLWSESGDLDFSREFLASVAPSSLESTPSCLVMEQMMSDCTRTTRWRSSSWRSYAPC